MSFPLLTMDLHVREKRLAVLYAAGACLSLVTVICTSVPWNYWQKVLDSCISVQCGCILYGTDQYTMFSGGGSSLCYFTALASLPAFVIAIIMASYHGYRVFHVKRRIHHQGARLSPRTGEVILVSEQLKDRVSDPGCVCWMAINILTVGLGILLFINAIILMDGYYSTCNQYRKTLTRNLEASDQMSTVIYHRLPCGAVYDFMDHLEPTKRPFLQKDNVEYNYFPGNTSNRERGPFINTGLSLQIAVISAWFNCTVWVALFLCNCLLLRSYGRNDFCRY